MSFPNEFDRKLLRFAKLVAEVGVNVLVVIFNKQMRLVGLGEVRIKTKEGRIKLLVGDATEASVDERIAKIESARTSLTEALSAIDELKERAEENKQDLEFLTKQIERAELDKANLSGELQTLKGLAALDSDSVRRVLKLPTRVSIWTERVIAFLFGVAASTVASLLYEYVVKKFI
ncbi:hypothetical protein [Tardiphaga sp. 619_E2_N8_5]|uniref:hypothetical protein n=1 Tax=unclassified Tardiphaga TaxID=2631404 RepID=UPI003F26BB70